MGSIISKGRKYSPKKRDPNHASTSRVEHENFASGDSQVQSNDACSLFFFFNHVQGVPFY